MNRALPGPPNIAGMPAAWVALLGGALLLMLVRDPFVRDGNLAEILVLVHILLVCPLLLGYRKDLSFIFLGAFLARVAAMMWDLHARSILRLPNAGTDAEVYFGNAVRVAQDPSTQASLYPKLMGMLFAQLGQSRLLGQYLNVLLGVTSVIILWRILQLLNIQANAERGVLLFAAFLPNSIILSAVFLREMPITFLAAVSAYFFAKWIKAGGLLNIAFSTLAVLGAAAFHSAIVGVLPGFAVAYLLWDPTNRRVGITRRTILTAFGFAALIAAVYALAGDAILLKFNQVEELSDILDKANRRAGGSAYLLGLEITSAADLARFAPLKAFVFMTAPLPFDWRGPIDILTFCLDSSLYLATLLLALRKVPMSREMKMVTLALGVALIGAVLVFGVGVGNAGTAIRHRHKLLPLFLILLALLWPRSRRGDSRASRLNRTSSAIYINRDANSEPGERVVP